MNDENPKPELSDELTPAERMYFNHLKNVSKYQKTHPEKIKEKNKRYNEKLKTENPEKNQQLLKKKKEYYQTVKKNKMKEQKNDSDSNEDLDK